MTNRTRRRGTLIAIGLCAGFLGLSDTALADPMVEPAVTGVRTLQEFTLVVPRETTKAYITMVEYYPPPNFEIQSFSDADGWVRDFNVVSRDVKVQKTVWTRVEEPPPDDFYAPKEQPTEAELEAAHAKDARFSFAAVPTASGPYPMEVRETYSDGTIIHWTGAPSHAFPVSPPAASIRPAIMLDYPSGGIGVLAWIAVIAGVAMLLGVVAAVVIRMRARRTTP